MERGGAGASPPPRREGSATGDPGMGNSPRACAHGACGPFWPPVRRAPVTVYNGRGFPPPRREGSATGGPRMGNSPQGCAHGACGTFWPPVRRAPVTKCDGGDGGRGAGESSRKPRRPRPYSRAFAGISLRSASCPKAAHWCLHACTMPHMETPVFITMLHLIATRHDTSLQTPFPHMRMRAPPPPYARTMPPRIPP